MKESYRQRLSELAGDLVNPNRFKPKVKPGVGQTVVRLTQMSHLPDNVFLREREANYKLDGPSYPPNLRLVDPLLPEKGWEQTPPPDLAA